MVEMATHPRTYNLRKHARQQESSLSMELKVISHHLENSVNAIKQLSQAINEATQILTDWLANLGETSTNGPPST
jgi:replicative DNA helicase